MVNRGIATLVARRKFKLTAPLISSLIDAAKARAGCVDRVTRIE
jgi:hypothetical protein